jgi:hypothetical protein
MSLKLMIWCESTENGKGYVNILRLTDIQDKPKLFYFYAEFTLRYQQMPEKEMLIRTFIFIDEAI